MLLALLQRFALSLGYNKHVVVVVLPDPFRGMGAWRNSTGTQQSGHAPRSGPEVKNGRPHCPTQLTLSPLASQLSPLH